MIPLIIDKIRKIWGIVFLAEERKKEYLSKISKSPTYIF